MKPSEVTWVLDNSDHEDPNKYICPCCNSKYIGHMRLIGEVPPDPEDRIRRYEWTFKLYFHWGYPEKSKTVWCTQYNDAFISNSYRLLPEFGANVKPR